MGKKSHQFLCKIAHLLLFHRCFPFISEGQTVTPATLGTSLHTEEHCCNFPTAYCERGRSLSLISEWGGKQMQFFFKEKILFINNEKQTKNTYLVCGIVHKNVEQKNNKRSINGTRKESSTASRDAFFSFREMISLLRLLLEHLRQKKKQKNKEKN